MFDLELIQKVYSEYDKKLAHIRTVLNRPLTLTEKVLYSHLESDKITKPYKRGVDYVNFKPDRVAMQDATAQMALLQFMQSGLSQTAVHQLHCDHDSSKINC